MTHYIKGKDGKFVGSVGGDGLTKVPTAGPNAVPAGQNAAEAANRPVNYDDMHNRFAAKTSGPRLLKSANTQRGYAIGIMEEQSRSGETAYTVVRLDPRSKYIVLDRYSDLEKARIRANDEWVADSGSIRQ